MFPKLLQLPPQSYTGTLSQSTFIALPRQHPAVITLHSQHAHCSKQAPPTHRHCRNTATAYYTLPHQPQSPAASRGFFPRSNSSNPPPPLDTADEYDSDDDSDGTDDTDGDDSDDSVDDEPKLAVDDADEEKDDGGLITLCGRFIGVNRSPLSLRTTSISLTFPLPAAAEVERGQAIGYGVEAVQLCV